MNHKQYTIAELRQKTREIFNKAQNEEVIITRYGEQFILYRLSGMTLAPARSPKTKLTGIGKPAEKIGGGENIIKTPEQAVEAVEQVRKKMSDESGVDFCKHGAVKGFCKKGCK